MSAHYIAAVDQGTTSTRCMMFDRQGRMVAHRPARTPPVLPALGMGGARRRRDLERRAAPRTASVARRRGRPGADRRAGDDQPTRDVRAVEPAHRQARRPRDRLAGHPHGRAAAPDRRGLDPAVVHDLSGLPMANYFSGPKIRWLLDEPGLRAQAEEGDLLFGTIDSWLVWNLTGGVEGGLHLTDVTNASRTMLMNLETLDWDDRLLAAMRMPRAMLPTIAADDRQLGHHPRSRAGHGDQRDDRRPAGVVVRADGVRARRSQVHVRHRQLPAAQHRHRGVRSKPRDDHHHRAPGSRARAGDLRAGGFGRGQAGGLVQWCRDNLGLDPLARPRSRPWRPVGAGQRWLLHGARVLGAVRAVLGHRGARACWSG